MPENRALTTMVGTEGKAGCVTCILMDSLEEVWYTSADESDGQHTREFGGLACLAGLRQNPPQESLNPDS